MSVVDDQSVLFVMERIEFIVGNFDDQVEGVGVLVKLLFEIEFPQLEATLD